MSSKWLPGRFMAACLWPGLPQLYYRGAISGLLVAVGFAAFFNLLVVTSLVWTDLATPGLRMAGWGIATLVWIFAAVSSRPICREDTEKSGKTTESNGRDPFEDVIDEYLKGHWYEVEIGLNAILRRFPRDAEARLLLATMFRHTDRPEEAIHRLDELTRLETCEEWRVEITRERKLLADKQTKQSSTNDEQTTEAEPTDKAKAA